MRNIKTTPRKIIFAISIFIGSILLSSCNNSINKESNPTNIISKENNIKFTPATGEEMYFYKQVGISYFCLARKANVEFPKAISIASNNFALIISSKHGGFVEEVGDEKLTNDQIYKGSYLQLVEGAIQVCPDDVPEEEKKKFLNALDELDKKN